jgi:hypothetical protein
MPSEATYAIVVAVYGGGDSHNRGAEMRIAETLGFISTKWMVRQHTRTYVYLHCDTVDIAHCTVPSELRRWGMDSSSKCTLERLPNMGREAHVYMHHLARARRGLRREQPAMTFFVQQNELYGLEPFLLDALANKLDPTLWFVAGASHACRGGAHCGQNFCWDAFDLAPATTKIFEVLKRKCPAANFSCALRGVFGVHRDAIFWRAPHTYGALLNLTLDTRPRPQLTGCGTNYGNLRSIPDMGVYYAHAFERLWPSIFGVHTKAARANEPSRLDSLGVHCVGPSVDHVLLDNPPRVMHFPPLVCRRQSSEAVSPSGR